MASSKPSPSTRDCPDADIFLMHADGTNVVQRTRNDVAESTPAFTSDGQLIVYASELDGNRDIFRMRIDGSDARNLTRHAAADEHPRVSPDGRRIFFQQQSQQRLGDVRARHDGPRAQSRSVSERNSEVFWMDL
jgi:TolB protein